ncbi:MAG: 1,4-dihydroxy-2-naphthoate polyprenyltransferase [Chloroflexi bacterium HGW-Chloroflexi-2]|jgi:1,4-dihydroxy-2-naphthoate octaprenyltransferase|nr:MAG: 1,4-dihydroxy-2-naphthoate polyprenyltransferase [Chloroflexi bacterium HGW-Chloroflexi-2]
MSANKNLSKFQVWLLASRPKTLPAAVSPVIIGSAVAFAEHSFRFGPALAAFLGALLLQIGANLANDVFDYEKGADQHDRLGPMRVTQAGLLSPKDVKTGMWVTFALAAICGIYMTLVSGWFILLIGLLAILAAIAYTGGPFPYGYKGLGEIFVFIFFGFAAVCGTYYAQTNTISQLAVLSSIPVGLLIVAILVVNNVRDYESDKSANKKTLAVRFGLEWARQEFVSIVILAFVTVVLLSISDIATPWLLLTWLSLPLVFSTSSSVLNQRGNILNKTLASTGQLTLVFSLLYAVGLILSVFIPI